MNKDESTLQVCDFCQKQMSCRNLFVALKVLEEELRFVDDPRLAAGIQRLRQEADSLGFAFPEGMTRCTLALEDPHAERLLQMARELLRQLRQKLRISNSAL